MNTRRQQSGVMLIEVMVGMLLFLIGILGVMGLQAVSMRNTVDAKYRTEATYLANQIIGRMWADTTNIQSYAIAANAVCPDPPDTEATRWLCAVVSTLPGATGANAPTIAISNVETDSTGKITGGTATVTVRWQKDASESTHNHTIVTHVSSQ